MRIHRWLAPSIALVALAGVKCGGDDSSNNPVTGTAGSSGSGGSGSGTAGKGGSSGSGVGTAGSAGKGGSSSAGGSAGSGGTTGGSGGTAGSAGAKADAAAGSGGGTDASTTDGPRSDAPSGDATTSDTRNPDATSTDGGGSDVAITDGGSCPPNEPTPGTPCTGGGICQYPGDTVCGCVRGDGGRQWGCRVTPEVSGDPDCPAIKPTSNTSCADAGPGTICRYGQGSGCICDQMDEWRCLPP